MKILDIKQLALPSIKVLRLQRFADTRGYFLEVIRTDVLTTQEQLPELKEKQISQVNESRSSKGVLRGLHTQCRPNLDKLLRVLQGRIIDIALDIRPESPTFGKAVAYELSSNPNEAFEEIIFIPFGFAHGIVALEDSHIQYFQTGVWNNAGETTIRFEDPQIDWSLCEPSLAETIQMSLKNGITSDKDRAGKTLAEWKEMDLAKDYVLSSNGV